MDASSLFEAELRRRDLSFRHRVESGRYEVSLSTGAVLVSLENLARELRGDGGDVGRVAYFTDAVLATGGDHQVAHERLFWCLEANHLAEVAPYRDSVSRRTDRVLADYAGDASWIRWVTPRNLHAVGLSEEDAFARAWSNLDVALRGARIQTETVDGVAIVWLDTNFPSKASLILAPGLRDVVGPYVGWPVLAVAPDRAFVYLWAADHRALVPRLGHVVVREYRNASHPLTTEVFEIGDAVEAIGAFPS
jgi:hypothetical protein